MALVEVNKDTAIAKVGYTVELAEPLKVDISTNEYRTISSAPYQVKTVNNYTVQPGVKVNYTEVTMPESILNSIDTDINAVRTELLYQLSGKEIAIMDTLGYTNDFDGLDTITQRLTSVEGSYISSAGVDDKVNAELASFDISDKVITYDLENNTTTAKLSDLATKTAVVDNNQATYNSQVQLIADDYSSLSNEVTTLTATTDGLTATIEDSMWVATGGITEYTNGTPVVGQWATGSALSKDGSYYQYYGEALGEDSDGWIKLQNQPVTNNELSVNIDEVQADADRLVTLTSGTGAPTSTTAAPKDIYVRTDAWYTESNTADLTTSTTVSHQYGPAVYEYDGSDWNLLVNGSQVAAKWAGGSSRLLYGPKGAITGWSFGDGSEIQSEFKIKADKFVLESATSEVASTNPFTVDASSGTITFNGQVSFNSVTSKPTHTQGALADRPSSPVVGSTYTATDKSNTIYTYTDNGWIVNGTPGALTADDLSSSGTTIIDGSRIATGTIKAAQMFSSRLVNIGAYKADGTIDESAVTMDINFSDGSIHIK